MHRGATLETDPTQDSEIGRMMSPEQRETARRFRRARTQEERLVEPTPEGLAEEHEVLSARTEYNRIVEMTRNFDTVFGTGPGANVKKGDLTRAKLARRGRTPGGSNVEHRGMSV